MESSGGRSESVILPCLHSIDDCSSFFFVLFCRLKSQLTYFTFC
jgi:hypothetical protein